MCPLKIEATRKSTKKREVKLARFWYDSYYMNKLFKIVWRRREKVDKDDFPSLKREIPWGGYASPKQKNSEEFVHMIWFISKFLKTSVLYHIVLYRSVLYHIVYMKYTPRVLIARNSIFTGSPLKEIVLWDLINFRFNLKIARIVGFTS